ncbi:hypothetical protein AD938_01535 [Gluconobacter japonicus]|nr:hypothetical protein AD938_01535 [Gluconobacter japonicus]
MEFLEPSTSHNLTARVFQTIRKRKIGVEARCTILQCPYYQVDVALCRLVSAEDAFVFCELCTTADHPSDT